MRNKTTREEILHVAYTCFKAKGFDEVSVDDICRKAGITKPTFYKYIDSKESILTSYYDEVCQDIYLHFSNIVQADTYYEQFHLFYDMIIDRSIELGPKLIAKMLDLNLSKDFNSFATRDQLSKIVEVFIDKGKKANEFQSNEDTKMLYDACNFAFLGLEYKWAVKQGQLDWKQAFYQITDAILQAKPIYKG